MIQTMIFQYKVYLVIFLLLQDIPASLAEADPKYKKLPPHIIMFIHGTSSLSQKFHADFTPVSD